MADELFGDREKALEGSFFAKENAKRVDQLRSDKEKRAAREGLEQVSGIEDAAALERLVDAGIGPSTWLAVPLIPLVEVAWANDRMEDKLRRVVLSAAEANGIVKGSPSFELVSSWLDQRPDARLLEAWAEYIVVLCAGLSDGERTTLQEELLSRARHIAEAGGGLLGFGGKRIGPAEQKVLEELKKAFER